MSTQPSKHTLRDVARLAGVNVATASRALSPDRRAMVRPDTAKRIDDAARKLGYSPNPIARSLRSNRSFTIGVLVPDLANPLYPPIVRGVEDALAEAGYTPLLANTDNDLERERSSYDALTARRVDGFVVLSAFRRHPLVEQAIAAGTPLVLSLRRVDDSNACSVCVDETAGVGASVAHLVELGHRTIGHVAGPQTVSNAHERYLGFLAAVASAGLPTAPDLVAFGEAFTIEAGHGACTELLARAQRPTAIVAGNDLMALGCQDALAEQGLRCPDDVSIVGYNDMPLADRLDPSLTSVRIPQYQLGVRSAEVLLELIAADGSIARAERLPPELVVRGSTRAPTTSVATTSS